jgi:hypothetical protein
MKRVVVHRISLWGVIDFGLATSESGPNYTADLVFSDAGVELPDSRTEPVRAPTRRSRGRTETSFCQTRFCRRNLQPAHKPLA